MQHKRILHITITGMAQGNRLAVDVRLGSYYTHWSYKCFDPYFSINQYVYL